MDPDTEPIPDMLEYDYIAVVSGKAYLCEDMRDVRRYAHGKSKHDSWWRVYHAIVVEEHIDGEYEKYPAPAELYSKLRAKLAAAEAEIASLRQRLSALEGA